MVKDRLPLNPVEREGHGRVGPADAFDFVRTTDQQADVTGGIDHLDDTGRDTFTELVNTVGAAEDLAIGTVGPIIARWCSHCRCQRT